MIAPFSKVVILGGSLMGESLALALQGQSPGSQVKTHTDMSPVWAMLHGQPCGPQVKLWCRRAGNADEAIALGLDATSSLSEAVADADLLVLDVPASAMARLGLSALDAGLPAGCLITDLGSVKQKSHEALREVLRGRPQVFIGSHPMVGPHQGNMHLASAHWFDGVTCLLTNNDQASGLLAERLEAFWQALGCHTAWLSSAAHDALVARISHLPHIMAAAAAHVCLHSPDLGTFGGLGLSDTTRVAAGDPGMWTEILTENCAAIDSPLRELISELQHVLDTLERGDHEAARQWLTAAKDRRDRLSKQA